MKISEIKTVEELKSYLDQLEIPPESDVYQKMVNDFHGEVVDKDM